MLAPSANVKLFHKDIDYVIYYMIKVSDVTLTFMSGGKTSYVIIDSPHI